MKIIVVAFITLKKGKIKKFQHNVMSLTNHTYESKLFLKFVIFHDSLHLDMFFTIKTSFIGLIIVEQPHSLRFIIKEKTSLEAASLCLEKETKK